MRTNDAPPPVNPGAVTGRHEKARELLGDHFRLGARSVEINPVRHLTLIHAQIAVPDGRRCTLSPAGMPAYLGWMAANAHMLPVP